MIQLPITAPDLDAATRDANDRQDHAERNGARSWGDPKGELTRPEERDNHLIGRIAEIKCAQFFDLELATDFYGVDCKIIEVRARRIGFRESGRDLAIRPPHKDNMRLPQVLVWIDRERAQATIVGWLCGWEGHQRAMAARAGAGRDILWQPARRVWFIPPPYHSVKSLQDWIMVGHPQHWAPEEYR